MLNLYKITIVFAYSEPEVESTVVMFVEAANPLDALSSLSLELYGDAVELIIEKHEQ